MQISAGKRASLLAALSLGALGSLVGCAHHHHPHHGGHAGAMAGISVSGTGEAYGAPDIARTTAGVEVRGNTAEEATAQATAQMEKLIAALKELGIAPADLRTQGYSVSYERDYVPPPQPMPARAAGRLAATSAAPAQPPGRYLVTNSVEITVRHVDQLGKVLSAAIAAGANNVWGISFDIEDKEPLITKAREAAFKQARARAERSAALAGVELGPLVAMDDADVGPRVIGAGAMSTMALREAVPVEGGSLSVAHTVQLKYALGEARTSSAAAPPLTPPRPATPPPAAPLAPPPAPATAAVVAPLPAVPSAPVAPAVPASAAPVAVQSATTPGSSAPVAPVAPSVPPATSAPAPAAPGSGGASLATPR